MKGITRRGKTWCDTEDCGRVIRMAGIKWEGATREYRKKLNKGNEGKKKLRSKRNAAKSVGLKTNKGERKST